MCVRKEFNVRCHCLNSCSVASHLTHHLLLCHYCKCQNSEKWQIPYIIMKIILTLTPFCDTLMACMMCIGFKERTCDITVCHNSPTPLLAPGSVVNSEGRFCIVQSLSPTQPSQFSFALPTNGCNQLLQTDRVVKTEGSDVR